MGVAFSTLIRGKTITLEDLAGRRIAFDAFDTIHHFLAVVRNRITGQPLRDRQGEVTSHLSGLLYRTVRFLEGGIQPVYVFDGPYPDFKARTVEKRRVRREEGQQRWVEALVKGKRALKYAKRTGAIDARIINSSKELLDLMGVPWVQAPSEGEAQCSWMCQRGTVFATASQDFDSLLFGSDRLVRNLSVTAAKRADSKKAHADAVPELIELQKVLEALALNREQFVIMALLVGTDYNEGIPGVGPKTALKLIKDFRILDNIPSRFRFSGEDDLAKAYEFFLNPPHTESFRMTWTEPDVEGLSRFLGDVHGFSNDRIDPVFERLVAAVGHSVTKSSVPPSM